MNRSPASRLASSPAPRPDSSTAQRPAGLLQAGGRGSLPVFSRRADAAACWYSLELGFQIGDYLSVAIM
uniref:Uncharacterized protein n=1 Tax=Zea mays TaxID=4577 RepID=B6TJM2_MAIZE|nr:hypothetical protein [Zea mays]